MKYVNLGRTGLRVSRIGIGTMNIGTPGWREWTLGEADARPLLTQAVEAGINLFDTADAYSQGRSEEILGKVLGEVADREDVVIATKVFTPVAPGPNRGGLSRKHLIAGVDASLRRLGTDYIDLLQIHRWDELTPISETMETLSEIVRAGKARYLGASNLFAWQLAKAMHVAERQGGHNFASLQTHYNLVHREEEREVVPLAIDQGIGLLTWSPLARGFLAGNRGREGGESGVRAKHDARAQEMYGGDSDFEVLDAALAVAEELGCRPAQLALAWQFAKPYVTSPIIGVSRASQLEQAVEALEIDLSEDHIERIERPYRPRFPMGHTDAALASV